MNREKEKYIAEKLKLIADMTPDYDARKLYIQQIAAALLADLDGEDAENQVQAPAQEPTQEPEKKKKATTKKKAEPVAPEVPAQEPQAEPEAETVTLADVRAVLARKSEEGKGDEVKALIAEFKASKLSEVEPQYYANLKARGEEL